MGDTQISLERGNRRESVNGLRAGRDRDRSDQVGESAEGDC